MALPFLGFPSSLDTVFAIALGFLIVTVAYFLPAGKREVRSDSLPFAEHKNGFAKEPNPPVSHSRSEGTIINDNPTN